jgi:fermentation-respiration switch protein FrsA (DUF1100 family)
MADWDPAFLDGLAGSNQLILVDSRGSGRSTDDGQPFGGETRLRKIKVPVLITTGTEDMVIPPSNALALVNAIPGAWLAQCNHGGNGFIAQYPRPLADLINSFLAVTD